MASSEQPPRPKTVPEETPEPKRAFRPVAITENARQSYVRIGKELREQGVEPRDLPAEVFASANAKIDAVYKLAEEYKKETDSEKKRNIAKRMLRAKDALEGRVVEGIEKKIGKLMDEKELRELSVKEFRASEQPVEVDASEFAASQYAKQDMQADMDTLAPSGHSLAEELIERDQDLDRRLLMRRAAPPPVAEVPVPGQKPGAEPAAEAVPEQSQPPAAARPEAVAQPVQGRGEEEGEWTPSPLEEQRSAVLGEVYALYRHDENGPMEFDAVPDAVHEKVQDFFDTQAKDLLPDGTIPEDKIEALLAELRGAVHGTAETAPGAEEASPVPATGESPAALQEASEAAGGDTGSPEKEGTTLSFAGIKEMLGEQLKGKAELIRAQLIEKDGKLHLQAKLRHGMAGMIELDGVLANKGDTVSIEGLRVRADRFEGRVRAQLESNLSLVGTALKAQLETKYGRPIASIRAGAGGLRIEFAAPRVVESDGRIEPHIGSEPAMPAPSREERHESKPEPARGTFGVSIGRRDDDLEYVNIMPAGGEKTRREWYATLENLIKEIIKQ